MSETWQTNRYLIARRVVQVTIIALLAAGQHWGWTLLTGNLSFSRFAGTVPLADGYAVLQMFCAGAAVATEVLIGAAIAVVFYGVLAGRAFCAWVCPVNLVTDTANWLRRRIGLPDEEPGQSGHPEQPGRSLGRNLRFWLLGLSLVLSLLLGIPAFEEISPVGMAHRGLVFGMGLGWVVMLALFVFDLTVRRNGFCGHVCPLGAFYLLLSRFAALRIAHDHARCTLCMECHEVCPEPQILQWIGQRSGFIPAGACTNCGRCVDVCRDDALAFGLRQTIRKM